MATRHQRGPEGDGGKRVAGVAECRQQEAPRRGRQISSASSRIMRLRASGSKAMGEHTRVPTPASR